MTPRERDTLETILDHVGTFNDRRGWQAKPHIDRLTLVRPGQTSGSIVIQAGDIVINAVTFRPTGAQCA